MKFKTTYKKAKFIDSLIDHYYRSTNAPILPLEAFGESLHTLFPQLHPKSRGIHKIIFEVQDGNERLVLKIGEKESIENDHKTYKLLPKRIRKNYLQKSFGILNIVYYKNTEKTSRYLRRN